MTIHDILYRYWGYASFRPQQEDIINAVLAGKDTLALLPTGGGKSICYQVPALAQDGICLVISPLIALMKDQVENLKSRGIGALVIYSGMQRKDIVRTLENARQEYFKFLYVSPERLETSLFKEYLPALNVNLVAVDEAHCISQWGYDFRPSYLKIAALREELQDVPVLAVTASATERVQKDICERLSSPPTPLHQRWRGDKVSASGRSYKKYKVEDIALFEHERASRKLSTEAESKLWDLIRDSKVGCKFRREHPVEGFIADFVCLQKGLIIEVDGDYHNTTEQKEFDSYRTWVLEQKGFHVVRFTNEEIEEDVDAVRNKIKLLLVNRKGNETVNAPTPLSGFAGEGPGVRWAIFRQSFERKNLSYSVLPVDAKATRLVDILKKVPGTAIVYCKSRKRTTEVSSLLQMHGLSANFYHAGLPQAERAKRQQEWIDNKTRIIVCTNAFGMGIDKPDVRVVVHMDTPDCLENYYQEAGRCGRDGAKAYAVLLYQEKDVEELEGLHLTRYPTFEVIRSVYEALGNFLQIPVHAGEDRTFDFRFEEFVRNFKLNVQQALYALQALESDGWLTYNEKNFIPSTLGFTTSKAGLYEFYRSHPEYENLLTALLRTYEGIFDFPVFISELAVAKLMREDEKNIRENLLKISSYGIIRYTPQNEEPQVFFRKARVAAKDLSMDLKQYQQRKEQFVQRVQTMISYLKTPSCRSRFTSTYFGDEDAKDCGICDNCLHKKKSYFSTEEFSAIASAIKLQLSQQAITAEQLVAQLSSVKKEKTWKVIQFLQAEKQIFINHQGILQNI